MAAFDSIPQEVLEHIAFFVATDTLLGPPSGLVPLLATSRRIYSQLSITSNPHLYGRIFVYKFDLQSALDRFGTDAIPPIILASELKQRCIYLKRIRARKVNDHRIQDRSVDSLHHLLFRLYLWVLENEEKNERQLREYADIEGWLQEYWFDYDGPSNAIRLIETNQWPTNDRNAALAMWLFWYFLRPEEYNSSDNASHVALEVLRIFALAAHKYNLTNPSWNNFLPLSSPEAPSRVTHFERTFRMIPVPVAVPAILAFLTLANQLSSPIPVPQPPSSLKSAARTRNSSEWECEWGRCISLAQREFDGILTEAFKPGRWAHTIFCIYTSVCDTPATNFSLEGVWEGQFTYIEFTAYAALLGGAPPPVLQKSMAIRHQQTWKLREYHLIASDASNSDSGIDLDLDANVEALPAGDPLRSYFPAGTQIKQDHEGLDILVPGGSASVRYQRASLIKSSSLPSKWGEGEREARPCVIDVIIMGEGHSSWGQFNLIGRVRPCDGFIGLSKEYVDGDRGNWLYRGYLVGNKYGNLVGRWRDTLSPPEVPGYEGCFAMSRRR